MRRAPRTPCRRIASRSPGALVVSGTCAGAEHTRRRPARSARGGDIAIDLGTANTVVFVRGQGIVMSEPSVVAIDQRTGEVHAVGADAQQMIGRTPASISADRPLRHGVIADFEVTEAMLRAFMSKVMGGRFNRPRVVVCAPVGHHRGGAPRRRGGVAGRRRPPRRADRGVAGGRDRRRPRDRRADRPHGRRRRRRHERGGDHLARRPRRLPLAEGRRLRPRRRHHAATCATSTAWRSAPQTSEAIKLEIGSRDGAGAGDARRSCAAATCCPACRGRSTLTSAEVRAALEPPVAGDARRRPRRARGVAARARGRHHPPRHRAHRRRRAAARASPSASQQETGMDVVVADDPLLCVALGAGATLEELDRLA